MSIDALKQFAKLRRQLLDEKNRLESRLGEINQVLGVEEPSAPAAVAELEPERAAKAAAPQRRGRRSRSNNQMSMREAVMKALANGPLGRKELVKAVQDLGYSFTTKDPLNSMGAVLYAKNAPFKKKDGKFSLPSAAAQTSSPELSKPAKKKRTMSPEARAKISAAQTARWAKQRR